MALHTWELCSSLSEMSLMVHKKKNSHYKCHHMHVSTTGSQAVVLITETELSHQERQRWGSVKQYSPQNVMNILSNTTSGSYPVIHVLALFCRKLYMHLLSLKGNCVHLQRSNNARDAIRIMDTTQ